MGKITLTLPDDLQAFVELEMALGDFADYQSYFVAVIRDQGLRKQAALHDALQSGLQSGVSARSPREVVDAAFRRLACD